MILRDWMRLAHRWLGIILTLAIITNFVAMVFSPPPQPIGYAPLIPLVLLLLSGMYMFFRPYLWKAERP